MTTRISTIQTKASCSISGGRDDIACSHFPATWIVDANATGTGIIEQIDFINLLRKAYLEVYLLF